MHWNRATFSKKPSQDGARLNSRGLSYQSQGKTNKAIVDFTEALRLDSNISINPTTAHSYCLRGVFYRARGDCKNAIADFTEAIRLDPRVALFYTQRGMMYRQKLEQDKAVADFTEAIQLEPKLFSRFRDDFRKYGKLCESRKEYDQAITAYSEVIQSFREGRSDYWNQLVGDYCRRARTYQLKGDFDNAITDYSEAICVKAFQNEGNYILKCLAWFDDRVLKLFKWIAGHVWCFRDYLFDAILRE